MKKFILFLTVILSLTLSAQVARVSNPLAENQWFIPTYTGVATDTLGTVTATTWSYSVPINKFDGVYFIMQINLADKTTGAAGVCTVQPQGAYFSGDTFANIGSAVTWTGVGSTDTIITIASVAAKTYYNNYRVLVTNTSGKSKVVNYKLMLKR